MKQIQQSITAKNAESHARSVSQGLPLLFAVATRATLHAEPAGSRSTVTEKWLFVYRKSKSEWHALAATADGVAVSGAHGAIPADVNKYPPIEGWRLDSDQALRLAECYGGYVATGGMLGSVGLFQLRMGNVDGVLAPLWWVPHHLDGYPFFIRADSGAPVFLEDDERFLFTESAPEEVKQSIRAGQDSPYYKQLQLKTAEPQDSAAKQNPKLNDDERYRHDLLAWENLPLLRRLVSRRPKRPN